MPSSFALQMLCEALWRQREQRVLWVPLRHHNLLQPTGTAVSIERSFLIALNMFGSTSQNGDIDMSKELDAHATSYEFVLKRLERVHGEKTEYEIAFQREAGRQLRE